MAELQQFCSLTLYVVSLFKMNTIRRIEPEEKGAPLVWFEPAGQEHLLSFNERFYQDDAQNSIALNNINNS